MRRAVKIRSTFITLLLGVVGGGLFSILGFPMPWLIGSMAMLAVVAVNGRISINMPTPLRNSMLALLGLMVGSTLNPDVLSDVHKWWVTILMLLPLLITQLLMGTFLLRFFMAHEKTATRFFGSAPGGLIEMVTLARDYKGDERSVLVMHMLRLSLLVLCVPLLFSVAAPPSGGREVHIMTSGLIDYGWLNMGLLLICLVGGVYGGRILRLPAATILGPFLLASIFYGTNTLQADPPYALMILAQIGVGADLGSRFAGYGLKRIRKLLLPTCILTGLLVTIAAVFAYGSHILTSLPFATVFLAFMPGGMTQMSLIALALGLNAGFVMTHLIARVFFVVLLAPICYKLITKFYPNPEQESGR